jgi:hypothetical protein
MILLNSNAKNYFKSQTKSLPFGISHKGLTYTWGRLSMCQKCKTGLETKRMTA